MFKNKNNDDKRITNLDFLRGFFIILAMDQHFTYYINMWYVEYFRDAMALTSTYKVHFPMIGHLVSTDKINLLLDWVFTPWVSQVYLTLAAFNLAKSSQQKIKEDLISKLKVFFLIFLFFVLENFIVAPNLGQAISFYPIMLWMIVLSLIAILFAAFGVSSILVLIVLSFTRFLIPIDLLSDFFQEAMKISLHPGFEYDARIEYFITSGCLGFLMGYVHYHKPELQRIKDYYISLFGIICIAFYIAWGDPYVQDASNVFLHEHDLARTFSGLSYILGVQSLIISFFLWLESKSVRIKVPIVNWVGENSIFVFGFHRIFFVRVLAPLSILAASLYGRTIGASFEEVFIYILCTLGVCWFIKKEKMIELVLKIKG